MKNSYWHYKGLEDDDISGFVGILLILVSVDAASLIFALIFLKASCNINMLQVNFILTIEIVAKNKF